MWSPKLRNEKCPIMRENKIANNAPHNGRELCLECPYWNEDTQAGECVYDSNKRIKDD